MHAAPLVSPRASTRRRRVIRLAARLVGTGLAVAAAAYAGLVAHSWYRYGSPRPAVNDDVDPLLDRFTPAYEVVELRRRARRVPDGSARYTPLPLKPPPHALVPEIDRIAEHQWTTSYDAVDTARIAFSNRLLGHAAVSKGAMEPHPAYVVNAAVPHRLN